MGIADYRRKYGAAFQAFYEAYPKHVAPNDAERAFYAVMDSGVDPALVVSKARAYAARCDGDLQWVPAPTNWLRAGHYDDADLFTDETEAAKEWFRQQYRTVNVKAVQDRCGVTFERPYPPDDITSVEAIEMWYRETARAWIMDMFRSKYECQPPSTTEPNKASSVPSSPTQQSLPI